MHLSKRWILRFHLGLWKTSRSTRKLVRYSWDQVRFRREYGRSCALSDYSWSQAMSRNSVLKNTKNAQPLFWNLLLRIRGFNIFGNVRACRVGDRSSVYFNVLIQVNCLYALCLWRCWWSRHNNMSSQYFYIIYLNHSLLKMVFLALHLSGHQSMV